MRLTIPLPTTFCDHPGEPKVRWSNWLAQLDNFFTLTDLTLSAGDKLTDRAKNAYLSSLLGNEGSRILMAHPVAATASTATFAQFSTDVQALFERPTNPVRAEYEFRSRRQGATESVTDYLTALRTLHIDCDNPGHVGSTSKAIEDHNLAMQLAIGCYSRRTQEKLLQCSKVELDKFLRIMLADEAASISSAAMRSDPNIATVSHETNSYHRRPTIHNQRPTTEADARRTCLGCGKTGHRFKTSECPAFGKFCNFCKKPNHFAKQCLQKNRDQSVIRTLHCRKVSSPSALPDFSISLPVSCGSQTASINFTIDTGADVSTIKSSTFKAHFSRATVNPASSRISNFDGSSITDIRDCITCQVSHKGRRVTSRFFVTPDNFPQVCGRDLIHTLGLIIDGGQLSVYVNHMAADLSQHEPQTSEELETRDECASRTSSATQPQPQRTFRGPYKVNDLVRVRLPHVPKGVSPFSDPRRVTAVLGNYTYRLSDGQTWNARSLVRVRQEPGSIVMEGEPGRRPHQDTMRHHRRRSFRKTRGLPPIRYPHGTS